MTDKEFKKLTRSDLIYIIYEYQKKQEDLIKENEELREKLREKELKISNAGSLAEVSAKLNGLFEAAQQTADDYIRGIKNTAISEAEKKAQEIIREAEKKENKITAEAGNNTDEINDAD